MRLVFVLRTETHISFAKRLLENKEGTTMERTNNNKQVKNCGTCPFWSWSDQLCHNKRSWVYHWVNEPLDSCEYWGADGQEKS